MQHSHKNEYIVNDVISYIISTVNDIIESEQCLTENCQFSTYRDIPEIVTRDMSCFHTGSGRPIEINAAKLEDCIQKFGGLFEIGQNEIFFEQAQDMTADFEVKHDHNLVISIDSNHHCLDVADKQISDENSITYEEGYEEITEEMINRQRRSNSPLLYFPSMVTKRRRNQLS
ncbi:hypothetical protein GJ496_009383 [Pomphorhynchus laevis]|nr:hypothetical protein GJ496_009383 [Pomphorhynchus laevis]